MQQSPDDPTQLLYLFTRAVDRRDAASAAACFDSDGVFQPGATRITGADRIRDFYAARLADPDRKTRHVWSNVTTQEVTSDTLLVRALLTNYALEPAVSRAELQVRIGNVECIIRRRGDEWVFAEQSYEGAFTATLPLSA